MATMTCVPLDRLSLGLQEVDYEWGMKIEAFTKHSDVENMYAYVLVLALLIHSILMYYRF